jgi:hypothetical protein
MIKIRLIQLFFISLLTIFLTGCSNKNHQSLDEEIAQTYMDNGRMDKYNELINKYGNIKVILLANEKEDSWWITNFTLWAVFSILPDIPQVLAGGGVIGIIYLIAWWIGAVLTGGGILAVLAYIGSRFGGVPGIPPAIMGIIYLGIMFTMLEKLFRLLFN